MMIGKKVPLIITGSAGPAANDEGNHETEKAGGAGKDGYVSAPAKELVKYLGTFFHTDTSYTTHSVGMIPMRKRTLSR